MNAPQSEKKTKIMYLITKGNFGGAQKYVFELAESLPKDQFEVSVVYGSGTALKEHCEVVGIPTHHIARLGRDISFFDEFRVLFDLIKLFRKERPDVIHVNSSKIGGIGSVAGRIARIPKIIFTAHGWAFKENRSVLAKTAMWFLSYLTALFAKTIITVSKDDFDRAQKFIGCRNKTTLIHIGVQEFTLLNKQEAQNVVASHTTLPEHFWDGTILLNIAELTKNKGLIYGIDALTHLPNTYKYLIISDGEDLDILTEHIKNKGLEKRVVLAGRIEMARTLLPLADIFLFPSIKEGLPYTLIEAGFAKVPVISTRVGGIPEIVTHEVSGLLVSPKSSKSLAHAIEKMTPEKRTEYAHALHTHTTQTFSFNEMLTKTKALYTN